MNLLSLLSASKFRGVLGFLMALALTMPTLRAADTTLPVLPAVSLRADPARTSEPIPTAIVLPGRFIVTRTGGRDLPLRVFFSYSGTAGELDYESLPESVLIPAGAESTNFLVLAKSDELVEGTETVIAKIAPSRALDPAGPDRPSDPGVRPYSILGERSQATVEIADEDKGSDIPVVSIVAERAQTSEPSPLIRVAPGSLIFKRTGPTTAKLEVHVGAGGTATPDLDYDALPPVVVFGEGQSSVQWLVVANDDEIVEPDETVIAKLSHPPTAAAIKRYEIDPNNASATVVIHDPDRARASLEITKPREGENFPAGVGIEVEAVAIDPMGYIPLVEFYAGERRIGVSRIDFIQAPPDGTPIEHSITWSNAPVGTDLLTARAVDSSGAEVTSAPVKIIVGTPSGDSATITIASPKDGTVLAAHQKVEIEATAIDPKGYINRLEFYDGTKLIDVSEIIFIRAPDPGTPIHHIVVWTNPPPGEHVLTARGVDSTGARVVSKAVNVVVKESDDHPQVVLAITAPDPVATEGVESDNAVFRIVRTGGPRQVEVTANLEISGTALNGIDYAELRRTVVIPAGAEGTEIVVKPVSDKALEGEETVVMTLVPPACIAIFPPPPECYLIAPDRGSARAVIRDTATVPANRPPVVNFLAPRNGSVFVLGHPIEVRVGAEDSDGVIERLDIYAGEKLLASTKLRELSTVWSNAPVGTHTLSARALDDKGGSASKSISIMVRVPEVFATRELPDSYSPNAGFTVTIRATPPAETRAWALEDRPPRGWVVNQISDEGVFDPALGKVKFGPFMESRVRELTYRVTPPATASGRVEFEGSASANGREYKIGGDRIIESIPRLHPADADGNSRIALTEVTGYAANWKEALPLSSVYTPVTYVTRAGMIWRNGEAYGYDVTKEAPLCWVPSAPAPQESVRPLAASVATRAIDPMDVKISVTPAPGSAAYAVEEYLPGIGWSAKDISDGGYLDTATGTIRWGVFLDAQPRVLSYTIVWAGGPTSAGLFRGIISVDGNKHEIGGQGSIVVFGGSPSLPIPICDALDDGRIRLQLQGDSKQIFRLESSSDLLRWDEIGEFFLPDGQLQFDEQNSAERKFYRLVTP